VTIPPDLRAALQRIADRGGEPLSHVAEHVLRRGLEGWDTCGLPRTTTSEPLRAAQCE
jgi:hypothetical protein